LATVSAGGASIKLNRNDPRFLPGYPEARQLHSIKRSRGYESFEFSFARDDGNAVRALGRPINSVGAG
jgi:hypothetical protein